MTDNIDQAATPTDDAIADEVQTEEIGDVIQEPDASLDEVASLEEGELTLSENDDTVQDTATDSSGEEDDAEDDQPAAS